MLHVSHGQGKFGESHDKFGSLPDFEMDKKRDCTEEIYQIKQYIIICEAIVSPDKTIYSKNITGVIKNTFVRLHNATCFQVYFIAFIHLSNICQTKWDESIAVISVCLMLHLFLCHFWFREEKRSYDHVRVKLICRVIVCVRVVRYYSCWLDLNRFTHPHYGDFYSLWGQKASPHNV